MSPTDPLKDLSPEDQRVLLRRLLKQRSEAGKRFPMSEGQQGLWHGFRRNPQKTTYNVLFPSRIRSPLDLRALKSAIGYLVDRHPCLRTTFSDLGAELSQQVHEKLPPEFTVVDAVDFDETQLRQRVIEEAQRPFDLEKGPLLRLVVLAHGDNDFVVLASTHHIVVDFWSLILLMDELRQVYPALAENRSPQLPPAPGNFASYVASQQKLLTSAKGERLREFWQRNLRGVPTVLDWQTDFARPDEFTGRASTQRLALPAGTTDKIVDVARQAKTTIPAVVLAGVEALVAISTQQKTFTIGSPFSGRSGHQFEQTVGFFANMLPLKADLSDDPSFLDLVRRAGNSLLSALEHEDYPLARIVRDIQPARDASRTPLLQVSCTFEKSQLREESGRAGFLLPTEQRFEFGGLDQESYYIPHPTCHYDIEFVFEHTETDLRGMICYCSDLFAPDTVSRIAENFQSLFAEFLNAPDQNVNNVSWDNAVGLSASLPPNSDQSTLVDLLDGIPVDCADSPAMRANENSQTHRELLERSKAIAKQLARRGVGRGDLIPVGARRGPDAIAAILGVIRSGAAVIPIDSDQPALSLEDLLADTAAKLVIVDGPSEWMAADSATMFVTIDELSEPIDAHDPPRPNADDLAYVIYTSGSTGRPKGVMVRHAAIVNTLRWRMDAVKLSVGDRMLMLLSHQFDAGFGLAISCLVQGATVVWNDAGVSLDMDRLIDQIVRDRITVLAGVPHWYRPLVTHPRFSECSRLTNIWMGGESMPPDLPTLIWQHSSARIWNFYGPTETAVEAAAWEVTANDPWRRVPIGRAIANTHLLILNDRLQPLPDAIPGQLAVSGYGLAEGYLNDPALTSKKFVPIPGDNPCSQRMYLTGDLCRRRSDGAIEFLGRIDNQVKLHGHRIELEEIDWVLRSHPSVKNAAVKLIDANTAGASLAAFVTRAGSSSSESDFLRSLKSHLTEKLPLFKRPKTLTVLDELPVGTSGKVARRSLPDPVQQPASEYVAPSTPLERFLVDCWEEMLQVERVGVHQDFFQIGGTSLQAATMTARLSEELGVHVPTALLFDLADIAKLAQRLVQLYEFEMADRFGPESVTAYCDSPAPRIDAFNEEAATSLATGHPLLAALKPDGGRSPLFMVHPPGGIVICYRELADQLSGRQPLIAIRSRGLHGSEKMPTTLTEMAADYVNAIKIAQPKGPYVVGGWSLGGLVGYEVARQLKSAGERVDRLILLDTAIPNGSTDLVDVSDQANEGLEYGIDLSLQKLSELKADEQLPFLWEHATKLGILSEETPADVVAKVLADLQSLFHHHVELTSTYRLHPLDVSVLLIRPRDVPFDVQTSQDRGWGKLVRDVRVRQVPGHHHSMVQMPQVAHLADMIEQDLARG